MWAQKTLKKHRKNGKWSFMCDLHMTIVNSEKVASLIHKASLFFLMISVTGFFKEPSDPTKINPVTNKITICSTLK